MAKSRELKVVITGDSKQLDRTFTKAGKDVDQLGKKADTMGKRFSSGMKVAGAAAAGALAVGLKQATSAAIEAEKSQARMDTQLKASGTSYKAHAAQIEEVIQKHSKLAGLDDEQLQDAFTNIVRVTGDVDKSLRLTGLAADFARAKHMDVAKAGELVGKVAGGNVGILSRYGITLDKGASSTEALAVLQQKFAGQAEAYGKTTAGATDRAAVGWENLQEVLGARLAPTLARVANKLADLANWAAQNPGKFKAIAITIGAVATAIGGFIVVSKVIGGLKALRVAIIAINVAMRANPIGLVVTALAALGVGLVIAYKKSETFRNVVNGAFNVVKKVVVGALRLVIKAIDGLMGGFSSMLRVLGKVPGFGWAKKAADSIDRAREKLRSFGNSLRDIPDKKGLNLDVKLTARGERALRQLNELGSSTGGPMGTGRLYRSAGGIIPGEGTGDKVPVMAEPGEFMIRKQIVQKFGPTFFAAINEGKKPQFKTSGGIIARANAIDRKAYPYVWGGGHRRTGVPDGGTGRDPGIGYDCSGAVAAALGVAPRHSSQFGSVGRPGPGSPNDTKIYYNNEHVFAVFNGRGWGTSRENPGGGPGWLSYNHRPGFKIVHLNDSGSGRARASGRGGRGQPRERQESGKSKIITAAAKKHGIDPAILWGLYGAESNFGRNLGPSSAGALGPFQFMPGTARAMGIDPHNFTEAAYGAAKYLAQYKGRGTAGMLAAYNAGPAGNPNNPETRAYIPKVLALAKTYRGGRRGGGGSRGRSTGSGGGATARATPERVSAFEMAMAAADLELAEAEAGDVAGGSPAALREAAAVTAKRKVVGARIRKIRAALKKRGLRPATRLRLTQELSGLLGEHRSLGEQGRELRTALAVEAPDTPTEGDPNQALIDAMEANTAAQEAAREAAEQVAEAERQRTAELAALRGAIEQQNAIATSANTLQVRELWAFVASGVSGELGQRAGMRRTMPGSGQLASVGPNNRY